MSKTVQILLVEDEVFIAMVLEMELNNEGYNVFKSVATGEEAVTIARKEHPDVILMDIRLSGDLDGIEAAERIRTFKEVPIIFMTGYRDKKALNRAKKINPQGYFIKPVNVKEIKSVIDSLSRPNRFS